MKVSIKRHIETLNVLSTCLRTDDGRKFFLTMGITALKAKEHETRVQEIITILRAVDSLSKFINIPTDTPNGNPEDK